MPDDDYECPDCDGPLCPTCLGTNWVDDPSDGGTMTCPDCDEPHFCEEG